MLQGDGIDMYDLIPDLKETDIRLSSMNESIWVGVLEKMCPSPPIPRRRARSYTRCPVYLFNGRRVFSMVNDFQTQTKDFYYIPDDELIFIERQKE